MLITLALSRPRNSRAGAVVATEILTALARWNMGLVRAGVVGPVYESGVRYERESHESFQDALYIMRQGWGDCSNLSAWRVGELLAVGEPASICVHWRVYSNGKRGYHVKVRRGNREIEDPSRILGM